MYASAKQSPLIVSTALRLAKLPEFRYPDLETKDLWRQAKDLWAVPVACLSQASLGLSLPLPSGLYPEDPAPRIAKLTKIFAHPRSAIPSAVCGVKTSSPSHDFCAMNPSLFDIQPSASISTRSDGLESFPSSFPAASTAAFGII
jgi:hypothetical protein